jgi:hypothetical protein
MRGSAVRRKSSSSPATVLKKACTRNSENGQLRRAMPFSGESRTPSRRRAAKNGSSDTYSFDHAADHHGAHRASEEEDDPPPQALVVRRRCSTAAATTGAA